MDTVTRNKTIKLIGIHEAEIRTSISDLIDNENVNIEIKNAGKIKIIIEIMMENEIPKIRLSFPPLIILSVFWAP